MISITKSIILVLFIGMLSACGTEEPAQIVEKEVTRVVEIKKEVTVEIPVEIEVTRIVEVPVTITFTPGPSPTPTITSTATATLTPTHTPTPFNVSGCQNLRAVSNFWNIDKSDYEDRMYPTYDALEGKCVKFFGSQSIGIITTDMGWLSLTHLDFTFTFDEMSPPGMRNVKEYSTIWGIWQIESPGQYEILIRRIEVFSNLQQPIEDDGFYMVGSDWDISAGRWKSLWPPGTIDNCYWERTNPDTGNIKANHFGAAGVYTTLYEGDLFQTDDCAPWVYVP